MQLEIHTGNITKTADLEQHITRRLQFALSWANHSLDKVVLRINDINGPKGGADKSCRIQIPLAGASPIVVEELQADLYVAIDRAVERAGRTLRRKLARKRQFSHQRFSQDTSLSTS